MSEFYESRRTVITDACGLAGMAIAGFAASMSVWDALATGFRTGKLERAFFIFLAVVLGASALGGLAGLAGGRLIGAAWERRHRRGRTSTQPESQQAVQHPPTRSGNRQPVSSPASSLPSGVVLRPFGAEVDQYLVLLRRSDPGTAHEVRTAEVLRRSANLGAWDGNRLVGAARTVSDGHATLITELVVDPDYRRKGIGRALLRAVVAGAPMGRLQVIAPDDAAAAFLRASGATPATGVFHLEHRGD